METVELRNFTKSNIRFVTKKNLTKLSNGRWRVDDESLLETRVVVPIMGDPLWVHTDTDVLELNFGIPLKHETVLAVDELPDDGHIYIVSKQYAEACRKMCLPTDRLRVTVDAVYVPGKSFPVACLGLMKVESCLAHQFPGLFLNDEPDEHVRYALEVQRNQDKKRRDEGKLDRAQNIF